MPIKNKRILPLISTQISNFINKHTHIYIHYFKCLCLLMSHVVLTQTNGTITYNTPAKPQTAFAPGPHVLTSQALEPMQSHYQQLQI